MTDVNESRGTVSIHIRIDPEAAGKLDAIAKSTSGSRSEVIEMLLKPIEVTYEPRTVTVPIIKGLKLDKED